MHARITAAALAICFIASAAHGETPTEKTERVNRGAYVLAIRCYIANADELLARSEATDPAGRKFYNSKAEASFNFAKKFGVAMGLTNTQMNHDFDFAGQYELRFIRGQRSYKESVIATCKSAGLM